MKKRMKMAAAVMAAVMGMMTLGGCGTASEKSKTAALTESQAEGTDAKQASEVRGRRFFVKETENRRPETSEKRLRSCAYAAVLSSKRPH